MAEREPEDTSQAAEAPLASGTRRGVIRWLIRETLGVVFVMLALFIPAGGLDWPMGWALVVIYAVWVAVQALILIPRCPELLAERASRRRKYASWDTALLGILGLLTLAKYVVAGLDRRFGWTPEMPPVVQIGALVIAVLGYGLLTWSMVSNAFFALAYRIQQERGHRVASGGPYRYIRHPGYAGSVAFELTTPIMLGSLWALIPGVLAAGLLVARTALEDKGLQAELDGYGSYARQVRFRLLPRVW